MRDKDIKTHVEIAEIQGQNKAFVECLTKFSNLMQSNTTHKQRQREFERFVMNRITKNDTKRIKLIMETKVNPREVRNEQIL